MGLRKFFYDCQAAETSTSKKVLLRSIIADPSIYSYINTPPKDGVFIMLFFKTFFKSFMFQSIILCRLFMYKERLGFAKSQELRTKS